jgi:hypothetical protein
VGYDMHAVHDGEYFRLNIWSMGEARRELWEVGVVTDIAMPMPPKLADFGLDEEPWVELDADGKWVTVDDEEEPQEPSEAELAYLAAVEAWRSDPPPGDAVGIAVYKLCSNDGWVVTRGEIETGLRWADAHHEGWREGLTDYVLEFVEWMTRCRDGFMVF